MICSKPYYWITCDHPECEERSPGEGHEYAAWGQEMDAEQYAFDDDWQQRGDLWFCPTHAVEEDPDEPLILPELIVLQDALEEEAGRSNDLPVVEAEVIDG